MFITFSVTNIVQSLGEVGAEPTFLTSSDLANVVGGIEFRLLSVHLIVASVHDVATRRLVGSPTFQPPQPPLVVYTILSIGIVSFF